MEIKKILVPVDGSDASKRAFKMAVDVAKVHGSSSAAPLAARTRASIE